MAKVSIKGAGIAGLSAAITLAEAGMDVTVYEKKMIMDEMTHTSALRNYSIPSVDALEEFKHVGITITPEQVIRKVVKVSPKFCSFVEGNTIYYTLRRGYNQSSVERQLLSEAEQCGVNIFFGESGDKDVDIIAEGNGQKPNIIGYGREYENKNLEKDSVYLLYNNKIAPQGYLCVIPSMDDVLTVLAVAFDNTDFSLLKNLFFRAVDKNKILNDLLEGSSIGKEIFGCSYYDKDPIIHCVRNGVLYVGDAGGFQDASRGFGIRYAILTGVFAAQSIITGREYPDILREYFQGEFEKNLNRRILFNSFTNDDYDRMVHGLGERVTIEQYLTYSNKTMTESWSKNNMSFTN